jgi:hypothetical protein
MRQRLEACLQTLAQSAATTTGPLTSITPDIFRDQFKSVGLSADHIRSLFNPEDQQDVKMAFDMLKDVWNFLTFLQILAEVFLRHEKHYGFLEGFYFIWILYRMAGKQFIPTNLYINLMIMIKNTIFCMAKAKVDDPDSEFWITLLGTDRLEELFGILRTMVGNDANLDILQPGRCITLC